MAQAIFTQEPANLNLESVVGDDFTIPLEFVDMNLSGYSFVCGIATKQNPANFFINFTVTETNLAEGLITLNLTETQTANIGAVSELPWRLILTSGAGFTRTFLAGKFTLNPNTISGDDS